MVVCVPASFILGIVGIFRDERKWLAILTALAAGGIALFGFVIPMCL